MSDPANKHNAARPQLTSSMRSSSYLSDHQQYRPPRQGDQQYHGIDTVVEDFGKTGLSPPKPKAILPFNGIPSEDNPPTIVDSGLSHDFSHPNCAPLAGHKSDRLIATLFYKPRGDHVAAATAASANGTRSRSPVRPTYSDSNESLPSNFSPTNNIENFPLEPPTQELEQLDHIYGSYISPLCITSFLHLMSTFPLPKDADEPHSSHRCLDNQENPRVVELTLAPPPSPDYLTLDDLRKHESIFRFEQEWNVDVVLQRDNVWRRHPRLVVFDMDSTLITQEVIDLLADTVKEPADLAARVAEITHRAMLGELEFEASFKERVALLKGLPATIFQDLQQVLDVTKGVPELIKALKRLGAKTAVLSGGFQPLTGWLAGHLGIDYAYANEVVIEDGKFTGEVQGTIVGKERKRDLLVEIAKKEGIDLGQVVAVGDGANDLLMLDRAGLLGVAWNAKPRVQMEADARLNGESLLDLLHFFGFTGEEIEALIS
ncbi:Fc.00g037680.m01.CDS01 [Cosmosporella sp. VM-42]